ncbi:hypothetical protein ASPACDRAFT_61991 [Aspergillus aculeatus ATCC 16872]|uniref:Uncharacterized protein n=1 Tax=Aspergillus aculeatus (strain ATCC 16872 / CBS 172.66 / WB 5094) TaxID=690307 RepID=A0A1L9WQP1_ASPA1|nr:uncharacterized protein ASPACDRAFT_61991 [Aspergillus aculeatus ATCC 16872]OJJ98485.1 hypothetical protein ASPACDRAFT_61991 [Aspergillus aculeatus ATCC 16872]
MGKPHAHLRNDSMINPHRAQQARMRKFLEENAWLNALPISASDRHALRIIQDLYEVRIDNFTFSPLEDVFLIDPAFTIEQCDPATGSSPSLPVEWIGWAGSSGFDREDRSTISSEMRINPRKKTLQGKFGFIWGGGWPGPGTVSFRATRLPEVESFGWQGMIDLEDIVGEWAQREPYGEKERMRQTLSPEELEVELHERDAARAWAREESLNAEAGEDDELSLLSDCFSVNRDVTMAVFDRSGNSVQIRLRVVTKYNRVWGEFDGDFRAISFVNWQIRDKTPAPTRDVSIGGAEDSHLLSLLARLLSQRKTLDAQVFDKIGNSMRIRLQGDEKVVVSGEFDGDFATLSLMEWKIDGGAEKSDDS